MGVASERAVDGVPDLDLDPFAPDVLADRPAFYERLREAGAVVRFPKYDCYGVGRYEEANIVLRDYRRFTNRSGGGLSDIRDPESWREGAIITSTDPPEHTMVRRTMNRILSPAVIRQWRESFEREGELLVSRLIDKGSFDVVDEMSSAFVPHVFSSALGVRMTKEQAVTVGDYGFNGAGPPNALFQQSVEDMKPFQDWLARSRTREGLIPGGWGEQVFDAEDAGEMPKGTASSIMLSLVRGGMDTTISAIGSAIELLGRNPDQWALFRENHELVTGVFDETIRLRPPVTSMFRATTAPTELGGHWLQGDTKVHVFMGSANLDPRKWSRPDRFDIRRKEVGHLALGAGIHNCIGQVIARLEVESVLLPFVRKVASFAFVEPPRIRPNNILHTLDSLPIRVERAPTGAATSHSPTQKESICSRSS